MAGLHLSFLELNLQTHAGVAQRIGSLENELGSLHMFWMTERILFQEPHKCSEVSSNDHFCKVIFRRQLKTEKKKFISALFINTKNWRSSACPKAEKWLVCYKSSKKMLHCYEKLYAQDAGSYICQLYLNEAKNKNKIWVKASRIMLTGKSMHRTECSQI